MPGTEPETSVLQPIYNTGQSNFIFGRMVCMLIQQPKKCHLFDWIRHSVNLLIHLPCLFIMKSDIPALRADTRIGLQVGCGYVKCDGANRCLGACKSARVFCSICHDNTGKIFIRCAQRPWPTASDTQTSAWNVAYRRVLGSNTAINRFYFPRF